MYHGLGINETLKDLGTSKEGLSSATANKLLVEYGENRLPKKKQHFFRIFFSQFKDFLIYVLLAALVISLAITFIEHNFRPEASDFFDAYAIGSILLVNLFLGFFQERKALKAIELLSELS